MLYVCCPFCGAEHSSDYIDEIEEIVLACRAHAHPARRGTLEAWDGRETVPIRPEADLCCSPEAGGP